MYKCICCILLFTFESWLNAALSSNDVIIGVNPAGIDFIDNLNDDTIIGERKITIPHISISTKDEDDNEIVENLKDYIYPIS